LRLFSAANSADVKTVAVIALPMTGASSVTKPFVLFYKRVTKSSPSNPNETQVEGLPAFKTVKDLPVRPEMVTVYVPPAVLLKLLPDIAAKGCENVA